MEPVCYTPKAGDCTGGKSPWSTNGTSPDSRLWSGTNATSENYVHTGGATNCYGFTATTGTTTNEKEEKEQ
jgi:hypothetical protein